MNVRAANRPSNRRQGVATLWVILTLLVALCMLCIIIDVGNLWVARVQLETSLEAAALGAVDHWGDAGGGQPTLSARNRGVALAFANNVGGQPMVINTNYNAAAINGNDSCDGHLVFGSVSATAPRTFDHNGAAGGGGIPTVYARASAVVSPICAKFVGITEFRVTAEAYAQYDYATGHPSLIWVDQTTCP